MTFEILKFEDSQKKKKKQCSFFKEKIYSLQIKGYNMTLK